MYHGIGILVSEKSYGFIVKSCREGCMTDGSEGAFYVTVIYIHTQMDQRRVVLGFGVIQTAGQIVNRVLNIIRPECFLKIRRKETGCFPERQIFGIPGKYKRSSIFREKDFARKNKRLLVNQELDPVKIQFPGIFII